MKPSVTIDERGVVLHVTNAAGEGVAVPLSMQTISEIVLASGRLKSRLQTSEGQGEAFKQFAKLLLELSK